MGILMGFLLGLVLGLLVFVVYFVMRALRSGGWDASNILNALRALSFLAAHPGVFPHLVDERVGIDGDPKRRRPFWYLPHDEFKGVVETV